MDYLTDLITNTNNKYITKMSALKENEKKLLNKQSSPTYKVDEEENKKAYHFCFCHMLILHY